MVRHAIEQHLLLAKQALNCQSDTNEVSICTLHKLSNLPVCKPVNRYCTRARRALLDRLVLFKCQFSLPSRPRGQRFLQVHLHRGLEVRVYLVEPRASKAIHPVVQRVSTVFRPDREDGRGHTLASLGRAGAAEMAVTSIARMI